MLALRKRRAGSGEAVQAGVTMTSPASPGMTRSVGGNRPQLTVTVTLLLCRLSLRHGGEEVERDEQDEEDEEGEEYTSLRVDLKVRVSQPFDTPT